MKQISLRFSLLLIGIVLMALSGAFVVRALVGSGPIMILFQGVAVALTIPLGTSILIISLFFVVIMGIFDYRKIGLGTVMATFLIGPINNIFISLIQTPSQPVMGYVMLIGGVLVNAIGASLYMYASLGLSPFEGIILIVHEKFKLRIKYIKITMDAIFIAIGFLLGGILGFGTIISLALTGVAIDFIYSGLIRRYGKLSTRPKLDTP